MVVFVRGLKHLNYCRLEEKYQALEAETFMLNCSTIQCCHRSPNKLCLRDTEKVKDTVNSEVDLPVTLWAFIFPWHAYYIV